MQNHTYSINEDRGLFRSKSSVNPETFYEAVVQSRDSEIAIPLSKELWRAFADGVFGGLTFMILIVYIFSTTLMAGHLHNSELYVEAFGIAGVYGNIFSFFVWGFNSGFIVLASRSFGLEDYKGMHKFFKKQAGFIFGLLLLFYIYSIGVYFIIPVLYPSDKNLIYWTRAYLVLVLPVNFCAFFMDTFRELFIANELLKPALYIEGTSMILSLILSYLLAFTLEKDFFGLVAGMIITQLICVFLYFGIWKKSSMFTTYWKLKDTEAIRLDNNYTIPLLKRATSAPELSFKHSETMKSIHENIKDSPLKSRLLELRDSAKKSEGEELVENKEKKKEVKKQDLNSNWGYFKFNIVFSITMFLDGCWWQIDAILCSLLFDGPSIAAQTTLTQFLNLIVLFGSGYTMTLSSKISQYLVILEVKKAKRITWIISIQMLLIGCLIAFPFIFFSEKISSIMIASVDTQLVLRDIMKIFGISIPFMFMSCVSFSTNRSINNQNKYFYTQLLCNYVIHFGVFAFLKFNRDMGVEALWYAYLASQASISIFGFIMMFSTNWKEEADTICKQMADGDGELMGH